MTASYAPNKAVRDGHDEDDERRNSGNPSHRGSGTETPPEDQWLVLVILYMIRAMIHSIRYMYDVGSNIVANIPREFYLNALVPPAEQLGIPAPANAANNANIAEEPYVPDFPVHMPHFDPGAGPDTHLGRRWYVVFVGRQVGVFDSWDEVLAATAGVSGQSQRRFTSFAMARDAFNIALARRNVRWVPDPVEEPEPSGSNTKDMPPKRDDDGPGAAGGTFGRVAGGFIKREV
ncbi:hypothetical protein BD410DRAFT_841749 [Rickenella mellea]|uniref:Ribonuclease H1 N-terminal domain-containing protein n=1 Tax=Rickenella mellea TaxID=50990 RepID=A0A4Y7PXJ4_9AGAM|nr:hypothetical protein BD410DRAFT_841749 [Rickenella mellea]